MKKIPFVMLLSVMSLCAMADDMPGIVVEKTDGSKTNIVLSNLLSIKFTEGNMVINGKDNSRTMIAMDEVKLMTFSSIATAIKTIAGTDNKLMTITDMAGRVVYKGQSQDSKLPELHGVYVINLDGKTYKVAVK